MDFEAEEPTIREPIVEGVFYAADPAHLEGDIRARLQASSIIADRADAVIAPYASYSYCGSRLAAAYKACAARPISRTIIVGPCHHDPGEGVFLPESVGFRVPNGVLNVDTEAVARARHEESMIMVDDLPHLDEHSIEVQLPFIRYLFPQAKIIPVLVGKPTGNTCIAVAEVLRRIVPHLGEGDLLVVSSNLSGSLDRKDARREAAELIDAVLEADWGSIESAIQNGESSVAGAACIAGALRYLDPENAWEVIDQGSSFALDADPSNCVEYGAVAHRRDNAGRL
jgi:hypothetical protein